MTQTHWWIAGACIASLGLGYLAGSSRSSAADSEKTRLAENPRATKFTSRDREAREKSGDELLSGLLKGRNVNELSDEELVKILLQLSKYDPSQDSLTRARQNYQLQLLLQKLPTSRLEQALDALAADPDSKRYGGINTILTALVSKDPQGALAWAKTQKNAARLISTVIAAMAKDDPMAAAELYRNELLDGTLSTQDGWSASYSLGSAMAKLGKKPLMDFLDSLPQQQQGNLLSNCYRDLPESERLDMLDEIYHRSKDGRVNDWSFKSIFSNFVTSDLAQAETWLSKIDSEEERAKLEISAASSLTQNGNTDAAKEWMLRAISRSQGKEKELFAETIQQMGYSRPSDIALFASLLPKGIEVRADDFKNLVQNMGYNGFSGLSDLAKAIKEPTEQTKLITDALNHFTTNTAESSQIARMNSTDFEILSNQLQKLNLTGDNAEQVQQALAAAQSAKPKARE
ncbi:MAG: hypothetical protein H8M99_11950 [Gloeobacteraceae cyanobacterium ES-bin-144]|nr:hypothetical protein [Verrucomicrobiales bacterium]